MKTGRYILDFLLLLCFFSNEIPPPSADSERRAMEIYAEDLLGSSGVYESDVISRLSVS